MITGVTPPEHGGEPERELVDEGRVDADEPARDLRAEDRDATTVVSEDPADRLARVAQRLSQVADELSRGTEQIEAATTERRTRARPPKPKPAPKRAPAPKPAAEPEPAVVAELEREPAEPEPEPEPERAAVVEPEPAPLDTTLVLTAADEETTVIVTETPSGLELQVEPKPTAIAEPEPEPPISLAPEAIVAELERADIAASIAPAIEVPVVAAPEPPAPPTVEPPAIEVPARPPEPLSPEPVLPTPPAPTPPAPAPEEPALDDIVFPQNRVPLDPPVTAAPSVAPAAASVPVEISGLAASRPRVAPYMPRNMSRRRFAALRAFADALLPAGGDLAPGGGDVGVAERIDASLPRLEPAVRRRLVKLIGIVDAAPIPTRGRPLSKLPPATAAAWLDRALESRNGVLRQAVSMLKLICANEFASTAPVEQAIGYTYGCETRDPVHTSPPLEVIAYPAVDRDHVEECDAVVVGSGAGGAAAAKELAEAGLSVVVIEEGAHFTRNDFAGPPWERLQRFYRANGTTAALGRPVIPMPMGRAVGGTTLVNAGTCFRTPDVVLKRWGSEHGIDAIDPASMAPVFDRVEKVLHVQRVPEEVLGENARVFRRGVHALGLEGSPVSRNISGCRGCGVCSFGCPSDAKQSTNLSYLPRAQRAGATIYARCRVDRILVQDGKAAGVVATLRDESDRPRATLTVRAPIVVLAAGAVHTPALLQANALAGNSGVLGANLRLHPVAALGAIFEEEVRSWRGTLQPYFVHPPRGEEDLLIEVAATVPSIAAGSLPGSGVRFKNLLARLPHVASAGVYVADTSSGRVRRGRDGEPVVTYRLNEHDARRLAVGMARVAEIFLAAGARAVFTGIAQAPWLTGPDDVADLRERALRSGVLKLSGFHPAGTARMGRDPARSVVDEWGECHDVRGLFVADASMLPGCPAVNPQVTIMAFATRTAGHIVRTRAALVG